VSPGPAFGADGCRESTRLNGISIRPAAPEDFPSIWPIFRAVVSAGDTYVYDPDTSESQARELWMGPPPLRTFVAELGGQVAGTYLLKPNQPGLGSHVANAGYMVHPAFRKRGVAGAMCRHSLELAKSLGFRAMQFNFVVSTNSSAIALWERYGFATVGRIPRAFRHAALGEVDALVMHRFL
jgi:ribosomal protein S18 acetylase RimI-like enzyme